MSSFEVLSVSLSISEGVWGASITIFTVLQKSVYIAKCRISASDNASLYNEDLGFWAGYDSPVQFEGKADANKTTVQSYVMKRKRLNIHELYRVSLYWMS